MFASPRPASPTLLAYIGATAFFMEALDSTIIATALPTMAVSFHVTPVAVGIGLTGYMLAVAVVIPASGWISDRFGARPVFCGAIALFTFASLLCGLSQNLPEFVAARVLQGVGGALMSPVGRLILLRLTPREDLVRMINLMTMPGLIGPAVGPPLGGLITTYASWRWIFLINVPIGLIGILMVLRHVPGARAETRRPFDALGFLLNGGALGLMLVGLDGISGQGVGLVPGVVLTLLGLGVALVAVRHLLKAPSPLVSLAAMRLKSFAVVTGPAGSLVRMGMAGPAFVLPLLLQLGFGLSPLHAGLILLFQSGADALGKIGVTRVLRRFGFRRVLIWSAAIYSVMFGAAAFFRPGDPIWLITAVLFACGLVRSVQFSGMTGAQFSEVPPEEMTSASTLASTAMPVNRAYGIALAILLLNGLTALHGGQVGRPAIGDLRIGLVACALGAALAILWYRTLPADVGAEVSGHRPRLAGGKA